MRILSGKKKLQLAIKMVVFAYTGVYILFCFFSSKKQPPKILLMDTI